MTRNIVKSTAYIAIAVLFSITYFSCANQTETNQNTGEGPKIIHHYTGSIDHLEYDSIYNDLILYEDGTFFLSQVDRIAEHHLNEKSTGGQYNYLSNNKQIGLFLDDGTLIMRFVIKDDNLLMTYLDGSSVINENRVWRDKL
ncbi:hypothetical protein [Membranihabitans marinus]|uniref:hypothetical protein n=1 Tax=Membranihabitans marinus TaxID=1227546 RepID=UPI001F488033|nr:hypothetical protein [Membranihabitans marinus]